MQAPGPNLLVKVPWSNIFYPKNFIFSVFCDALYEYGWRDGLGAIATSLQETKYTISNGD